MSDGKVVSGKVTPCSSTADLPYELKLPIAERIILAAQALTAMPSRTRMRPSGLLHVHNVMTSPNA